ncbi:hypothetical protein HDU67_008047 [Dinochytrium kinnereticum]|nr:hypothetical protein HDU67_008047 [Dinochytrium kinnereticum]
MEEAFATKLGFQRDLEEDGKFSAPSSAGPASPESIDGKLLPSFFMDEKERASLLQIFFEKVNATLPMQFIHEGVFRNTSDPCPALLLAMCATASACGPSFVFDGSFWPYVGYEPLAASTDEDNMTRSDHIFAAAVASLDFDRPTVEMCQAIWLLVIFCVFLSNGRGSQGWLLGGMAIRMVPMLRLDVDPDVIEAEGEKLCWVQKEIRRRLFAMAMTIDMFDLIHREKCSGIWRKSCDVKLPQQHNMWCSVDPVSGEPTIQASEDFDLDINYYVFSLSKLMARTIDYNLSNGNPFPNRFLYVAGRHAQS